MKKILAVALFAGVVSLVGISPALAQGDPALVKVPFRFIVGDKVLPAGSYRIAAQTQDASILLITSLDGKSMAAFAATQGAFNPLSTSSEVRVAFKSFDGQYFLSQVSMPGRDTREVLVSKVSAERTLAKLNLMPAEHADVAK
jgi:hypothetical protein